MPNPFYSADKSAARHRLYGRYYPKNALLCRNASGKRIYHINHQKPNSEIQHSRRLQEENEHDHRHDILDHNPVEALESELPAAVLDFLDDPVRADHPADQDSRQHGDEGHHKAVADVVHQIQKLAHAAVGQRELNIELAISQRDDDRSDGVNKRQRNRGGLPLGVEDFHTVGRDGLQHRHTAGQRRESRHDEEGKSHNSAQSRHRGKDLGQGDEHQAGAGFHAFYALKNKDRGDYHHAGEQGHTRVKIFNLVNGCVHIHVFLNIRAVSDHDAHGDAQGEEDLAHRVQQDLQEALDGQPLEIGRQINRKTLQACARHTGFIRMCERQREDRDGHDHDQHDRHQYLGTLLNSLLHAVKDDPGRQQHKDCGVERGLGWRSDEVRKEAVLGRRAALSGQVDHDITGDPAADDRVIGHDQHRHQESQNSQETPLGAHLGVGPDGILTGPAADRDIAGQQREAESESQDKIDQNEEAAAVLSRQIGETPEIADADRAARGCHNETNLACKTVFLVRVTARGAACCRFSVVFCHSYSLLYLIYYVVFD